MIFDVHRLMNRGAVSSIVESEGLHDILETAQHGSSTDERQKSAIHSLYLHLILNHFLIETIQTNLMFAYKSRKMHFLSVSVMSARDVKMPFII